MIPTIQPNTALVRIGEPHVIRLWPNTRETAAGEPYEVVERIYGVKVRCACGKEYTLRLSTWLHRAPRSCIRCLGRRAREAAAAVRERRVAAYMQGWAHGAAGKPQLATAIKGYRDGYAWGCKQRAKTERLAARKYRGHQRAAAERRTA